MIVTRLVLHGRDIRSSMGIAGIGGLCRAVITMLIESSVIYATRSLLVLVPLSTAVVNPSGFLFILAETQARALLRPQSLDRLSNVTAIKQVIAPLLIILRVANKTALTSNTIVSGCIDTFKARTPGQSAGGDGTHPSGDSMSSVDERGTNSVELLVEVETTIESRPDNVQAP